MHCPIFGSLVLVPARMQLEAPGAPAFISQFASTAWQQQRVAVLVKQTAQQQGLAAAPLALQSAAVLQTAVLQTN